LDVVTPIILLIPIGLLLIFGWATHYKKAYWLISGYNMMSAEKKAKVDIAGLARFLWLMTRVMALHFGLISICFLFGWDVAGSVGIVTLFPVIVYFVLRMQAFDGNTRNPDGSMTRRGKMMMWGASVLFAVISVGVSVGMYYGLQPANVRVTADELQIKGFCGENVPRTDIAQVEQLMQLPPVEWKMNGSAIGNHLKGSFRLEGIGKATLHVDRAVPSFIKIVTSTGRTIIFNTASTESTQALYAQLIAQP
jgi:hypothetical protein